MFDDMNDVCERECTECGTSLAHHCCPFGGDDYTVCPKCDGGLEASYDLYDLYEYDDAYGQPCMGRVYHDIQDEAIAEDVYRSKQKARVGTHDFSDVPF